MKECYDYAKVLTNDPTQGKEAGDKHKAKCLSRICKLDEILPNRLPKYKGCYKENHGFLHLIGKDITVKECLDAAKRKGYMYVALQEGRMCWADKKIGAGAT